VIAMIGTVAVGVGGVGGWQALTWAAGEARVTGAHLAILRVCRPESRLVNTGRELSLAEVELVDPALARAVAAVRTQLGGHRVSLSFPVGDPGHELVRAAVGADLMVIGASDEAHRHPGDTVNRVVDHTACPVVVVRPVDRGRGGPFAGHVVIGVDGGTGGHVALEFGLAYADRHRLPVAAVHVSAQRHDDFWYDDTTLSTHFVAEPADLELLAKQVEPWHHKFPDVPVKRAVMAGTTADGLLRSGAGARLQVLGNLRRGPVGRLLTGNITRAVVDRARHPVAIAHVEEREGVPR
jgi:nucleotide-binding universal stress UspA family protein